MPRSQRAPSPIKRPEPRPLRQALPTPFQPATSPIRSTFGQTIKEGLAFGIGSSIARNMVDSVMHTPTTIAKPIPVHNAKMTEFKICMESKNDYDECKFHLE